VVTDNDGRRLKIQSISEAANLPEDSSVTVEVTIAELWNSSSGNVQQMGRVQDAPKSASGQQAADDQDQTETARFVVWAGNDYPHLREETRYRLVGAETNTYNGSFQVVVDGQTVIQSLE
jgi:hypothetical protein